VSIGAISNIISVRSEATITPAQGAIVAIPPARLA
jgi:hypothetical protein